MSSLASQLAEIKANNNATILDKAKRRKVHGVSLVYDPKEAATQDYETIYYDCLEAFNELQAIDPRFSQFSRSLFSETSIRFDRLGQNAEQETQLNAAIGQFLMLVSGYLHINPSFRAVEWLVRRFHIQIHNVEFLLLSALPWHDAPEFVRILDVVNSANLPPIFQFLAVCKTNMQGPSLTALVRVLVRDTHLFHAVNNFELEAVKLGYTYNRQLVFWSSINVMMAMVYKEQGHGNEAADRLLPLVSEVVVCTARPQAQIAAYMVLAVLVSQFPLSDEVCDAAAATIVQSWSVGSCRKGLACLATLCTQTPFAQTTYVKLVETFGTVSSLVTELLTVSKQHEVGSLVRKVVLSVVEWDLPAFPLVIELVRQLGSSRALIDRISAAATKEGPFDPALNSAFVEFAELCAAQLTAHQLDRLEIALQSSITRASAAEAPVEEDEMDVDDTVVAESKEDLSNLLEEAADLDQSTQRTFLESPLPQTDARAQLWVKVASTGGASLDDLRAAARVSPEAQLSFMLAIAIGPWPSVARAMAVRVAAAMVSAVVAGDASAADFQWLLPLNLFLLSDRELRVRKEAADLLKCLSQMKPGSKSPKFMDSKHVSWLSRTDLQHSVKRLMENVEECVMDPDFVVQCARRAGKAAWCEFLVSHALTSHLPQILWIVLRCLTKFKGVTKQLSTLLQSWNEEQQQKLWTQLCAEAKFPLSGVERALVASIHSNERCGTDFLLAIMRTRDLAFAEVAGDHIVSIWREVFREDTQERVATQLVELSVNPHVTFDPRDVLLQLQPFSAKLFIHLLVNFGTSNTAVPQLFNEAAKRRRRRSSSTVQLRDGPRNEVSAEAEKHLRRTTLVLELLERSTTSELTTDVAKLLATLFDILEELMALGEGSHLPVLYTEELLAGCMMSLVQQLKSQNCSAAKLNSLKVSTLVNCIRTSPSPQVQNRLLLLVAALATLCPDAVLHGVMPIFTFMGANTVRLDNDFSAHVIEQTIERVIPALVAAGDKHEEIEMALLSFVAAFPHVPRHRRNTLFGALIKTLGPQQSLYKLLLMLGQRYAETKASRRPADGKALVHFATPFLRAFSPSEQLHAMNTYVQFVAPASSVEVVSDEERFSLLKIRDALQGSPSLRNDLYEFLAWTAGEPEVIAGTQPLRVTVNNAYLSGDDWQVATSMIGALLGEQVPAAADVLVRVLELLPINRFVQVVLPLATSSNARVLELVRKKFGYEPVDDKESVAAAAQTLQHLTGLLVAEPTSHVVDAAEQVTARYGVQLRELEMQLLEQLVGTSGLLSTDHDVVLSSILAINTICQHLGAATYGFFPRIFPVLCTQVQKELGEEESDFQVAVFALFSGLVRQMPRFMAPETPAMLDLLLSSQISIQPRFAVLKVLQAKIEPRTLLAALCQAWPAALRGGLPGTNLFFTLLGSTVESIERRELAAEMPQFTALLISCLSTRQTNENLEFVNQVEARAIECALAALLRLNDRVVRPQFRRVVQWGFDSPSDARRIALLKFVNRVFAQLKSVVTNYFGYMLDDCCALLTNGSSNATVRKLVLQAIITSLTYDQDDFWQSPARFDQLSGVLLAQLTHDPQTHGPLVVKSILALAITSSANYRKRINDGLARLLGCDASVSQKVWVVKVFSSLYKKLGEAWVANLPQLVPLIAELLDDEDESVELETRKSLVPVIEGVLGESLDRYLA